MTSSQIVSAQSSASAQNASIPSDAASRVRIAILILALPLFTQTFHYMKDLWPLWALSKAFPLLSAPLAIALLWQRVPRDALAWLGAFLWLVLMPSVMAIFAFDQSFFIGLTAQVKLLGMLHAVSFLGLLLVLRPSLAELLTAFAIWGMIMAVALSALWALAPMSWYATGYEFGDAPLLSIDHRGARIRMPMFFILVGLFVGFRAMLDRITLRNLALVMGALALAIFVVKTRAMIAATLVTIALVMIGSMRPALRITLWASALIGALIVLQLPEVTRLFDADLASGADIRITTFRLAMEFMGGDPGRWLLGAGTISPIDPGALARFFNHFFFLSDIGWLGVIFEYGLVGAAIFAGLIARAWWIGREALKAMPSPFLAGLQDYILFVAVISPLYSTMTLQPGEVAVIAAIFIYARLLSRDKPEPTQAPQAH